MVIEEKFIAGQDIPALQAVGWEGTHKNISNERVLILQTLNSFYDIFLFSQYIFLNKIKLW